VAPILKTVSHVRLRLRAQRALLWGLTACGPSLLLSAGAFAAYRLGILGDAGLDVCTTLAWSMVGLAALVGAARGVDWLEAAIVLDEASGLHDRLSTALELAGAGHEDEVALLQYADGLRSLARARVEAAAPWRMPRGLRLVLVGVVAVALGIWSPLPQSTGSAGAVEPSPLPRVSLPPAAVESLSPEDREALEAQAEALRLMAKGTVDPNAKRWFLDVEHVVRAVLEGRLSKAEAMKQLAELEKKQPGKTDGDGKEGDPNAPKSDKPEEQRERMLDQAIADKLERAVEHALKGDPKLEKVLPELELMKKALQDRDLDKLADLFDKLRNKELTPEQRERLAKALEKFADKLKDRSLADKMDKLKRDEDRLKKQRDETAGGLSKRDEDRLGKTQRELEKLERDHGDQGGAQRQLERLERESRQAAADLQRRIKEAHKGGQARMDPKAEQELRRQMKEMMGKAAEELRRQTQGQQRRQAGQMGRSRIVDIKEIMRRDRPDAGRDEFEKRAGGDPKPGEGKDPRKGRDQGRFQPTDRRGEDPNRRWVMGTDRGPIWRLRMKGGEGEGQGHTAMEGDGESARLKGGREHFVEGKKSDGPTRKQVFQGAARKGFARGTWGPVYGEYADVAEEAMDKEHIPAGRRTLVRRYFELIRPR